MTRRLQLIALLSFQLVLTVFHASASGNTVWNVEPAAQATAATTEQVLAADAEEEIFPSVVNGGPLFARLTAGEPAPVPSLRSLQQPSAGRNAQASLPRMNAQNSGVDNLSYAQVQQWWNLFLTVVLLVSTAGLVKVWMATQKEGNHPMLVASNRRLKPQF